MTKARKNAARVTLQPRSRGDIRRSGRQLKQSIVLLASALALGTIFLLISVVSEQRDAAEERAWNDVDNLSGAFEEQIRRVLNSVQGAVALLKPRLAAEGVAFDFVAWTKHVPEFAESTVQIAFVGPDGMLLASSLVTAPQKLNLSDREHIRSQLIGSHKGLFIGKPVIGRMSKQVTIQVTDRVEKAGGELAGIIVFSLSPEFLTTLHRAVNLGKTGSMILAGQDGVVRASYGAWQSSDYNYIGSSISGAQALIDAQQTDEGSYHGANPLNGQPAFLHWQKVKGYPLVVIVSLGDSEVFAAANYSTVMLAALGAGVLLLTILTMLILIREISRRVQREIALYDESRKVSLANENLQRRHRQLLTTSAELAAERTRLQRVNLEIKAAKEQADEANQAKSLFLMNMSHEFRTPMHAILNYTNMALKKFQTPEQEKLQKYLTNIQSSGMRLLELLNALLDLAKLESGKLELRIISSDMEQIIRQSHGELSILFEQKQLEFQFNIQCSDSIGLFDKERLTQVFINLFSNAIKFSPNGGLIEVTIKDSNLPKHGPALHCVVTDQGIGIPEAELDTIFGKFTQSSKTYNGAGGSGLGLAICREIVQLHGGLIWAAPAPSGGAAIHLILPREAAGQDHGRLLAPTG